MDGAEFGVRWIHIEADIGSCWSRDCYYALNCVFPCSCHFIKWFFGTSGSGDGNETGACERGYR